jgi:hypothetical protein
MISIRGLECGPHIDLLLFRLAIQPEEYSNEWWKLGRSRTFDINIQRMSLSGCVTNITPDV